MSRLCKSTCPALYRPCHIYTDHKSIPPGRNFVQPFHSKINGLRRSNRHCCYQGAISWWTVELIWSTQEIFLSSQIFVKYSSNIRRPPFPFQSQSTPLWRISRVITCLVEKGMKTLFTRGGISRVQARRMINKHFSKTPKTKFRLVRISSHMGIAHGLTVQIRYISSRHFYLCLKLPQELFMPSCTTDVRARRPCFGFENVMWRKSWFPNNSL